MAKTDLDKLAQAAEQMKDLMENPSAEIAEELAPEETSDTVSTSSESESIETSEPSVEVKNDVNLDEVDSKGVPYKNRAAEAERKLKQLESKYSELAEKMEAFSKQTEEQSLLSLRGISYDNQNISTGVTTSQGQGQATQGSQDEYQEAQAATIQDVHQVVAKLTAKERNDQMALNRYPDLYNANSLLYKETQARINAKARAGVDRNDPFLLAETAAAAFGDLVALGKITPRAAKVAEESARRSNADAATVVSSRTVVKNKTAPQLTKVDAYVLNRFAEQAGVKMSPEQFLKRKLRK